MRRSGSFHGGESELPAHDDEKENWLKFYVNPYSGAPAAVLLFS
jgi:hypothetical protein